VPARFSIAAAETVAAAALRRAALAGEDDPVARVGDTEVVPGTLRGKVEFEADGEGREDEVLEHLLRKAVAETWRSRIGGLDLSGFVKLVEEGDGVAAGEGVASKDLLRQIGKVQGLSQVLDRLGFADATPGRAASAVEFVLEGLHLTRRLAKDVRDDGRVVYGGA